MASRRGVATTMLAMLAVSCGGDSDLSVPEPASSGVATTLPSGTVVPLEQNPDDAELLRPGVDDVFQDDATVTVTAIALDSTVSGTVVEEAGGRGRALFCVQVPDDVAKLVFEVTEPTADVDLFVGYADLATLTEGGVSLWFSQERGVVDEQVVIEPGASRGELGQFVTALQVNRGPYYVEVNGPVSSFSLNVTGLAG